ncbi:sigma-70 family RNA polymerase sigma factor [Wolbachia endosymbiont of Listronotus oregonensis]|uniref:sigma-70 family RNA polymerase sigma factor n=1 Tax=unclassified Wolbachia TaxID=2640676 RepID=UPI002227E1A5|nr:MULTISPECIES: sigma-70 family RNA polymerase sigma factor [unclassified Wolbachia]WMT83903.1 sigma-70 family RNA polymerase sigma factor [Wolbachia endosymbiont of Listronotus oregonensis]
MTSKNSYTGIDQKIVKNIRHYAKRLRRDKAFVHEEIEDIEQELLLDCLPGLENYNALEERYDALITQYVKCRALNLKEKQLRKKRIIDFVDETDYASGEEEGEDFEYDSAVRIDVNEAIEKLPPKARKICKLLMKYEVSEISRKTGIPEQTIYSTIKALRKNFAHLKTYLFS